MSAAREVRELQSGWEDHLERQSQAQEVAQNTRHSYRRAVERYLCWCDETLQGWSERTSLEVWREELRKGGYSASSVNTWFSGVKTFLSWAVAEGALLSNPAEGLRTLRPEVAVIPRMASLTDREVLSVLEEPDDSDIGVRDRAILSLMAYAAARVVDIERASLEGLARIDGRWQLDFTDGQEAMHVAHDKAVRALDDWLAIHPLVDSPEAPLFVSLGNRARGQRLSGRAIRRLVKERIRSAGIEDGTAMSLRASAIRNALRQGLTFDQVREVSRHKSLDSVAAYALPEASEDGSGSHGSAAIHYGHADE